MATRMRGSKNLRFDRVVQGVGRIQQTSGTDNLREFRRRDALLTKLSEGGHLETLRLFKLKRLTIKDLLDADRNGRLGEVSEKLRLRRSLTECVEKWLPASANAEQSRRRYGVSWRKFLRTAQRCGQLAANPSVQDLAFVDFKTLKNNWGTSNSDWNRCRAMVSAFLTHCTGSIHSPFRLEVMGRFPLAPEPEGVLPDVTPAQFWSIVKHAPDYTKASYVAMAVLGAGPAEYLGIKPDDLSHEQHTVLVRGTKTSHRKRTVAVDDRFWTDIVASVPSKLRHRWLNVHWKRACEAAGVRMRMYDLRHLSAQFAGDHGATDRDLTVHLGHSNPKMSHRYSRRATARAVAAKIGDALASARPNLEVVA